MTNNDRLQKIISNVQQLSDIANNMIDSEMYPVSFFSQAFDLIQKLQSDFHTLEAEQVEMFAEQLKKHQALILSIHQQMRHFSTQTQNIISKVANPVSISSSGNQTVQNTVTQSDATELIPKIETVDPLEDKKPAPVIIEAPIVVPPRPVPPPDMPPTVPPQPRPVPPPDTPPTVPPPSRPVPPPDASMARPPRPAPPDTPPTMPPPPRPVPPPEASMARPPRPAPPDTPPTVPPQPRPVPPPEASMARPPRPAPPPDAYISPAAQPTLNDVLEKKNLSDLRKAFSLNDHFRYRKELFDGNEDSMNKVINTLNNHQSLNESISYLEQKLHWDFTEPTVKDFVKKLEMRFL